VFLSRKYFIVQCENYFVIGGIVIYDFIQASQKDGSFKPAHSAISRPLGVASLAKGQLVLVQSIPCI